MTTREDIIKSMIIATNSSGGCQKIVKSFIKEFRDKHAEALNMDIAKQVAVIVSDYKKEVSYHDKKTVNNVINDVSRICRDLLGYSIVCKSRKEGTYIPVTPQPRKKSGTAPLILDEWKGTYVNEIYATVGASVALDWLKNSLPDSEIPAFTKLYTEYVKEKFSKESV